MSAAQRFLVLVHGLLALGFVAYTLLVVRLYLGDAGDGYISEGADYAVLLGLITTVCVLLVVAGVGLWARTGKRRFVIAADLLVGGLSWTILLPLAFAGEHWLGFLGFGVFAVLVAIAVAPPNST